MIEVGVIEVLLAVPAIVDRISTPGAGERIYLNRIPQGVKITGGTLVVTNISEELDYGLGGEALTQFSTLQIDCYDLTATDAQSLAELVKTRLAGNPSTQSYNGAAGDDHNIESIQVAGGRSEFEKPKDASDDWRPRRTRDFRIHHS
jgi:hypothetical protein